MMQLGTRWAVGAQPPARLPEAVVKAIAEVERELAGAGTTQADTARPDTTEPGTAQPDTTQWRWTLTWLEGRPVVQLDDGTTIRVDHAGAAVVTTED